MFLLGILLGVLASFLTFLGFAYSASNSPIPSWPFVILWLTLLGIGVYYSDFVKVSVTFPKTKYVTLSKSNE